jgi:acetyl-CoA carboxylase biotin carboxyl carrier protein
VLLVIESMKMEIPVESPEAGRVVEIRVEPGQSVDEGDVLVVLED